MDVVWLKKDARLSDHGPLSSVLLPADGAPTVGTFARHEATATAAPFVVLYLYEPSLLRHQTAHGSHVVFTNEGLAELEAGLQLLRREGAPAEGELEPEPSAILTTRVAEAVDALEELHRSAAGPIARLLSHEETGHLSSYGRDKAVKRWCRANGVLWQEFEQSGVVRGLKSRADAEAQPFAERWNQFMSASAHPDPRTSAALRSQAGLRLRAALVPGLETAGLVAPTDARLAMPHPEDRPHRQRQAHKQSSPQLDYCEFLLKWPLFQ